MDSVSQLALGAAVGVAVMGRRTAAWKAAAWGGVAGTLPDLDVLIDHGDPILNMVLHRAQTHAVAWQTLFSLPFAAAVAWLHGERAQWRRWWLALWLALVTHALLDAMTVYGTQLALPFSRHPYGVGSIFIIDPLYTLPLLAGVGVALAARGAPRGLRANLAGLALSSAYLAWSVAAQWHVQRIAQASLAAQGIDAQRVLVTPTAFNTVLWRIVAMTDAHYHEGFHSLLDDAGPIAFDRFERGAALEPALRGVDGVRRVQAFSKGFYRLLDDGTHLRIADLRMGQEPTYIFDFAVAVAVAARRPGGTDVVTLQPAQSLGTRPDLARGLDWLGRRARGERVPPPR